MIQQWENSINKILYILKDINEISTNSLLYFSDFFNLLKRELCFFMMMIHSRNDYENSINQLKNLFTLPNGIFKKKILYKNA